jgi:hypothetical protein
MDDLAPSPTQRTFEDVGRVRDENFRARKKAVKKALPAPSPKQDLDPEVAEETEPEADTNHQLDLLA